jgi:hypothetical protein
VREGRWGEGIVTENRDGEDEELRVSTAHAGGGGRVREVDAGGPLRHLRRFVGIEGR